MGPLAPVCRATPLGITGSWSLDHVMCFLIDMHAPKGNEKCHNMVVLSGSRQCHFEFTRCFEKFFLLVSCQGNQSFQYNWSLWTIMKGNLHKGHRVWMQLVMWCWRTCCLKNVWTGRSRRHYTFIDLRAIHFVNFSFKIEGQDPLFC